MDASDSYKLSDDDVHAVYAVTLLLTLLDRKTPYKTDDIFSSCYAKIGAAEKNVESMRKTFSRDREKFQKLGVFLSPVRSVPGGAWELDRESTLVAEGAPVEDYARAAFALQPLLSDPNFLPKSALASALAKLSPDFDSSRDGIVGRDPSDNPFEEKFLRALRERKVVKASYRPKSGGKAKSYKLMPLGVFALRDRRYVVCANEDNPEQDPHTFLVSNFENVVYTSRTFDVPDDFDIARYERLPFQMGPEIARASFFVPQDRAKDLRRIFSLHGRIVNHAQGGFVVSDVAVASIELAASWAYANGVVPLSPEDLVSNHRVSFATQEQEVSRG